jgi:tetratricopeptide (TPR) repeat protein
MTLVCRISCVALACVLLGAARPPSPKEQMRFGVAAAQQGLWREAMFRWEKLVKIQPDNPRLRNNLAVAYESIGDVDGARRSYREALRLAPASKEIRDNYNSFLELCKSFRQCADSDAAPGAGDAGAASPPDAPVAAPDQPAAPPEAPSDGPSPQATPIDAAP